MTYLTKRPESFKIAEKTYFKADDLKKYDPGFFAGTSRSIRLLLEKRKIPRGQRQYATYSKKKGWTICNQNPSTKAALLLSESWVLANIPT